MTSEPTTLSLREPASDHARSLLAWMDERAEGALPTTRPARFLPAKHFEDIYRNRLAWIPRNGALHQDLANAVDDLARTVAPVGVVTLDVAGARATLFVDADQRVVTGFRGA